MPPRSSKGSKAQNAINPRIKQTTLKNFIVVKAPVAGGSSAAVAANAPPSGAASAAQAAATAGSSNRAGRENVPLNAASPGAATPCWLRMAATASTFVLEIYESRHQY